MGCWGAHQERTVRKGDLIRGRAHTGFAAPPLLIRLWEAAVRVRLSLAEPKFFFLSSEADPLPCPPPAGKRASGHTFLRTECPELSPFVWALMFGVLEQEEPCRTRAHTARLFGGLWACPGRALELPVGWQEEQGQRCWQAIRGEQNRWVRGFRDPPGSAHWAAMQPWRCFAEYRCPLTRRLVPGRGFPVTDG